MCTLDLQASQKVSILFFFFKRRRRSWHYTSLSLHISYNSKILCSRIKPHCNNRSRSIKTQSIFLRRNCEQSIIICNSYDVIHVDIYCVVMLIFNVKLMLFKINGMNSANGIFKQIHSWKVWISKFRCFRNENAHLFNLLIISIFDPSIKSCLSCIKCSGSIIDIHWLFPDP